MVFENGLINIQAEAYNGARTVCKKKEFKLFQPFNNFCHFFTEIDQCDWAV